MVAVRLLPAVAALLWLTSPLAAQPAPRLVTVLGEARAHVAPDRANVTVGAMSQAKTARDALDANSRVVADVIKTLRDSGVAETEIRTSGLSVQPVVSYPSSRDGKDADKAPRIIGYTVSNQVTVRLNEPAKLGELLDRLVAAGANQISEVRFAVSDEGRRRDAVRADAVRDARRKAELYAAAAGARVGRVMAIAEADAPTPPRPLAMRAAATDAVMAVPVAPGEQTLRVQLWVTWELDN